MGLSGGELHVLLMALKAELLQGWLMSSVIDGRNSSSEGGSLSAVDRLAASECEGFFWVAVGAVLSQLGLVKLSFVYRGPPLKHRGPL